MADETNLACEAASIPAERVYQEFASEIRHESEQFRNYLSQFFVVEGALITAVLWKSLTDLQVLMVEFTGVLVAGAFGATLRRSLVRQRGLTRRVKELCQSHQQITRLPLGEEKSALLSWAKLGSLMSLPPLFAFAWVLTFAWHFISELSLSPQSSVPTLLQRAIGTVGMFVGVMFYWRLASSRRARFLHLDDFIPNEESEQPMHVGGSTETLKTADKDEDKSG